MLPRDPADARPVLRLDPRQLILPAVLVCVLAGLGILWSTFHAPVVDAPWSGLYTSEQWDVVKADFSRRGFAPESVHVVTATVLANGHRFGIIGAAKRGNTCLAVARGAAVGATICRISKPLMLFYAPDTCAPCSPGGAPVRTFAVIGLIRSDAIVTVIAQGHEGGVGSVPAGIGYAFTSGFGTGNLRIRARDASGRVLASFSLHRR
jgi:hypothetical protein